MRVKNTIKSTATGMIAYVVSMIIGFIARAVFVKTLGTECTGLNGLYTNILSMLSIVETGFGTAIIVNLYKEVASDNKEKIKSLLQFYKKIYRIVAIVVFSIGLLILPFLKYLTGEVSVNENIHIIFILYLLDVVVSYLLTYKRSILLANQKNYYINLVNIGYNLLMNISQIVYLLVFKNFTGYIVIKIICRAIENLIISKIADKKYTYITEKNVNTIDETDKKSILTRVKGLFFHRVATFVVMGTDNIIISTAPNLGIVMVGLYSNYYLIIEVLKGILKQIFSSMSGGIGTLLVEDNKEKTYKLFKTILLMNSWVFAYAAISFYFISKPFIIIWLGGEYLLTDITVLMLTINLYFTGLRQTYNTFKEAAGIFYEDRFVAIIESIVNLIVSLILVRIMGLPGVFLGTIISTTLVYAYTYPKFVYKQVLGQNIGKYVIELIKYLLLFVVSFGMVFGIIMGLDNVSNITNNFATIAINIIICLIVPNLIYLICFRKTAEFKYYYDIFKRAIEKIKRKETFNK